jgi:hypothetical protein
MSCYCPSGYTLTPASDDCILTMTATTSGGSFFYTGVAATNIAVYNKLGVIFYENITNLSFPITNSGTTGSVTTENGTPLVSTQFLLDDSGRILNMVAGGVGTGMNNNGNYGPTSIQNNLWGLGSVITGRLNDAGLWASIGNPAPPLNEWLGFSYCLNLTSGGTYYVGLAADNDIKLSVNNQTLVETNFYNFTANTSAMTGSSIVFTNWHVFPITLQSGLNIIEVESLNIGQFAAFAAEIYSGSVSTLSGYTSYSQLSANTLFSTLNFIGQNIPLSSSGATTGTGYTCPDGYSLYTCSGSPYCIFIDKVGLISFCISNTGLGYDDNFTLSGTYNSEPYWSGSSTSRVIYLTTGNTWCLSDSLGGTCLLEGAYPCTSTCPDLCDTYFTEGVCPTPTPTPTVNCSVLDFNAVFDCEVTPTPSVTPTISTTPTMTPTPSPSNPCGGRALNATITGYTPTPTPTISVTPTMTPQVTRPCNISGTVTFNPVIGILECPSSKKFVDCSNGSLYYAVNPIILPSGGTLTQSDIFKANVNGVSRCVVFLGIELDVIGVDQIDLVNGPLGSITSLSSCDSVCTPDITPTPTVTPTPSVTPTLTPTPTSSPAVGYYLYQRCSDPTQYVIQTLPGPSYTPNQVFSLSSSPYNGQCWKFISYSTTYPTLPLGSTSSYLSGNSYPTSGITFFENCSICISTIGDTGKGGTLIDGGF